MLSSNQKRQNAFTFYERLGFEREQKLFFHEWRRLDIYTIYI